MRELTVNFGNNNSLYGIVSEPSPGESTSSQAAFILLNSGLLHRIGPNRVYVKIARQLAQLGFTTLRFDLSGIGDSPNRDDNMPFMRSSMLEVRQAMDYLAATRDIHRFILTGICSGADLAVRVACEDARVTGIAPIDFYTVPSMGYLRSMYMRRLVNPRSWWKLLTGKSELWSNIRKKLMSQQPSPSRRVEAVIDEDSWPPAPAKVRPMLETLAKKQVKMCFVYSSGSSAHYNFKQHFERTVQQLQRQAELDVVHHPTADHGFTLLHSQQKLLETIITWTQQSMPVEDEFEEI